MKKSTRTIIRFFSVILFFLYILLLSYFLFFSERYGRGVSEEYRYNLELLKEIRRFITYRHELGMENLIINIIGNVAAFMPFGFCLPVISKRYSGFFRILFLSAGFSFAAEIVQLFGKVGSFDVDDILLNTIGGVLGYIGYRIIRAVFYHRKGERG
ncbi:MAG: VanZ family protein [Lachnospiraceae bacterium]|nr:VanZ family protein [Lachnospiraceae bacterium]